MSSSKKRLSLRSSHREPKKDKVLSVLANPLSNSFGGKTYHPRGPRTFNVRNALHLVLKSSIARGAYSFLAKARQLEEILQNQALKSGVRLLESANAGNHLHLLVESPSRKKLLRFLRAVSGLIVRKVFGAERGRLSQIAQLLANRRGFFDARPFSRVVSWGNERNETLRYISEGKASTTHLDGLQDLELRTAIAKLLTGCDLTPLGFG